MKRLLLSMMVVAMTAFAASAQKTWNFSTWDDATFSETTTIEGLKISASSSATVAIDGNNKSMDDYSFTKRLKLGGTGNFENDTRIVSFPVTGKCTITVYGMSGSNGTERTLGITNVENKDSDLGTLVNDGAALGKTVVNYEGGAGTIYMYSKSSGFNIYAIMMTPADGSDVAKVEVEKTVVSKEYYDILGKKVSATTQGLVIERTVYEDGSVSSQKTVKADR